MKEVEREEEAKKKLKLKKKKKEILKKAAKEKVKEKPKSKRKVYLEKSQIGAFPSPEDISSDSDIPDDPCPSTSGGGKKALKSERKKFNEKPSQKSDPKSRTKKVRQTLDARQTSDVRQLPKNDRPKKRPPLELEEYHHHRKPPTEDRQMSKIERFAAVIQEENVRHIDRHAPGKNYML